VIASKVPDTHCRNRLQKSAPQASSLTPDSRFVTINKETEKHIDLKHKKNTEKQTQKLVLARTDIKLQNSDFWLTSMTYVQEMEWVHTYNPGALHGALPSPGPWVVKLWCHTWPFGPVGYMVIKVVWCSTGYTVPISRISAVFHYLVAVPDPAKMLSGTGHCNWIFYCQECDCCKTDIQTIHVLCITVCSNNNNTN